MEKKILTALEISSTAIKCVTGYYLDGKPIILDAEVAPLEEGIITEGIVNDFNTVSRIIRQVIDASSEKLNISINEVILVVPSIGFDVYHNSQTTSVVSTIGIINKIDVNNVRSQVSKAKVSEGSVIVDIIPNKFIYDSGESVEPPYGEKSDSLTIDANLHAIPSIILESFKKIMETVGLRIVRIIVGIYAACSLVKCLKTYPKNYILVDLGADVISGALIGRDEVFTPTYNLFGSNTLTNEIKERLGIDFISAQHLKEKFGVQLEDVSFETPILAARKGKDKIVITNQMFNECMKELATNYIQTIDSVVQDIISKNPRCADFPILFVGGGSKLAGLKELADSLNKFNNSYFVSPTALGARDQKLTNCVGALYVVGEALDKVVESSFDDDETEYEATTSRRIKLRRSDVNETDDM